MGRERGRDRGDGREREEETGEMERERKRQGRWERDRERGKDGEIGGGSKRENHGIPHCGNMERERESEVIVSLFGES